MAKIEIKDNNLVIVMKGARKFLTMKSELKIPLENVLGATADPEAWEDAPTIGEKRLGTDAYGHYFGGTFVQDGDHIFYDLKRREDAVVITLKDEEFARLIIGVENPLEVVATIEQALDK